MQTLHEAPLLSDQNVREYPANTRHENGETVTLAP
jgi:hypothetical protein